MRRSTVLVIVLSLLFLGAACSGDETLSKAEFTDQANAVCKKANDIVDANGPASDAGEQGPEETRRFLVDRVIPGVTKIIEGIDRLEPPEELVADVNELVREARMALRDVIAAAKTDDPLAAFSDGDPFAKVDELLTNLDLDECVGGS